MRFQPCTFLLFISLLISGCATASSNSGETSATTTSDDYVLTSDTIETLLEDEWKIVQRCYEFEVESQPELSGEVRVSFQVLDDRTLRDVTLVDSNLQSPRAESCILRQIGMSRLLSLAESRTVVATLQFQPESITEKQFSLTRNEIQETIKRYQSAFEQCGKDHPDLVGEPHYLISVSFRIQPSGMVSDIATYNANAEEPELEQCVHEVFEEMLFPPFDDGSVQPVVFPIIVD